MIELSKQGAPFPEIPSGIDIARWFVNECDNHQHGCEGMGSNQYKQTFGIISGDGSGHAGG